MAVKCERYRKGHESHYIPATPSVEYSTLYTPWVVCNEIHALCSPQRASHLSPTLLPGELRTKRTAVVQTVTASVTVWLRETSTVVLAGWGAAKHEAQMAASSEH